MVRKLARHVRRPNANDRVGFLDRFVVEPVDLLAPDLAGIDITHVVDIDVAHLVVRLPHAAPRDQMQNMRSAEVARFGSEHSGEREPFRVPFREAFSEQRVTEPLDATADAVVFARLFGREPDGFVDQLDAARKVFLVLAAHRDEHVDPRASQFVAGDRFDIDRESVVIPYRSHPQQIQDLALDDAVVPHRVHAVEVEADFFRAAVGEHLVDQPHRDPPTRFGRDLFRVERVEVSSRWHARAIPDRVGTRPR